MIQKLKYPRVSVCDRLALSSISDQLGALDLVTTSLNLYFLSVKQVGYEHQPYDTVHVFLICKMRIIVPS